MSVPGRILMYHSVGRAPVFASVTPEAFREQLAYLRRHFTPVSLEQLVAGVVDPGAWPRRPVALTFDDGLRDNFEEALPRLQEAGVPAVVFACPGLIRKGEHVFKLGGALPVMTWDQLKEWRRAGMEVGGHTLTHADLTQCSDLDLEREVVDSKKELEDRLGGTVRYFAYPKGRWDGRARSAVIKAGYRAAVTVFPGPVQPGADLFSLGRLPLDRKTGRWRHRFVLSDWYPRFVRVKVLLGRMPRR